MILESLFHYGKGQRNTDTRTGSAVLQQCLPERSHSSATSASAQGKHTSIVSDVSALEARTARKRRHGDFLAYICHRV
jgi:hypothetical protein